MLKESLKLLGVNSSGLEVLITDALTHKNDDDVFNEASKIDDLFERETYLKKFLKRKPSGYVKTKRCLIELIKNSDPLYACDLAYSICQFSPTNPRNYLLFAEIAIEHGAWLVAKSALEAAKWLCLEKDKDILDKTNLLLESVVNKIKNKEKDNSESYLWRNKSVSKYWILERLYYRAKTKKLLDYSFKLLDIFGDDRSNYEEVYKIFSKADSKEAFNQFVEYVKKHLSVDNDNDNDNDKINFDLYLGIAYFYLGDFDLSINHLQEVIKTDNKNPKAMFYLALNFLVKNNLKDFVVTTEKIIPLPEAVFTALYFINCAILEYKLSEDEFPDQKNISSEISKLISKLLKLQQVELVDFLIERFKKLNLHLILPFLNLYLAELFIKEKKFEKARELLSFCSDGEAHRLYAWICRLEGKEDLAEKELIEYRKSWIPEKDMGLNCQLVSLNFPDIIPADSVQIFKLIEDAYKQTRDLINQFDLEYGLNAMTCIETTCQDCCTKTFPYISYTEFLYLKNWLDSQPKELKDQIRERSVEVVNLYKARYGKEPPFMYGETFDLHKEYPGEFVFNCPNLGDNKCNVYEARPFTCRAYSYASQDGRRYKGCNYFYEQLKGATKLHNVRKVVSMESFFDFVKKTDEKLIGTRIIAPIPVWFAQSYEETLQKLSTLSQKQRTETPKESLIS